MQHLFFGPIVTLTLSREMTVQFPDRDTLCPVVQTKALLIDLILKLLLGSRQAAQ